jgi:biotin carboxyl carrier protein
VPNPWRSGAAAGAGSLRRFRYVSGDARHEVTLEATDRAGYRATLDGEPYPGEGITVTVDVRANDEVALGVGPERERCFVARQGYDILVSWRGDTYTVSKPRPLDVDAASHAGEIQTGRQMLTAPMAGTVIKVLAAEGDRVEAQQTLVVLGAMKMEHAIVAPHDSVVTHVPHAAGDVVSGGEVLVELDGLPDGTP